MLSSGILLALVTLTLGLIATFTKTSSEGPDGRKKPTKWGWMVAVLICLSASITIFNNVQQQRRNAAEREIAEEEARQERLLSLLAAGAEFQLNSVPYLNLSLPVDDGVDETEDEQAMTGFPGFGDASIQYTMNLDISSRHHYTMNSSGENAVMPEFWYHREDKTDEEKLLHDNALLDSMLKREQWPRELYYSYDILPNERSHLWSFVGYRNLSEFLFDFQKGRTIGSLEISSTEKEMNEKTIRGIEHRILKEGFWIVRVFLRHPHLQATYLQLVVPVHLAKSQSGGGKIQYSLIAGAARLDNEQYDPI